MSDLELHTFVDYTTYYAKIESAALGDSTETKGVKPQTLAEFVASRNHGKK